VSSQRLYDHMTRQPPAFDVASPFSALCGEVLGASKAFLLPVGSYAPLISQTIAYPSDTNSPPPLLELPERFSTSQTMCVSIDPALHGGANWAVPLWSERGLIGVFLLGDKRNGGLFTQEEIEIARASGERMIDMLASAEMSRRLMEIQRERLAQSQVIDRRTRRMLHDEVLPSLHAVMLTLPPGAEGVVEQLTGIHRQIADLLHQSVAAPEVAQLGLIPALRKSLSEELGGAFDQVSWDVQPEAEAEAEKIPVLTAEVLYYAAREAMRNAALYGRGDLSARALRLKVEIVLRDGLWIRVEDDGVGLERTHGSAGGSGHGLALHSTMMAVVGGALTVESVPGQFTRVVLTLPHEK
jgi:signal transduction histidine kinase